MTGGSDRAVAITGLGAVSGFGWGVEAFWTGLRSGATAIGDFRRFDHAAYRTHVAAEVEAGFALDALAGAERASLADRFALFAASEALAAAGLPERLDALDAGLFFGSSTGGMLEAEEFFHELTTGRRRRVRLGLLSAQQPNGPGDAVARVHGVGGPVETVASACASATLALGAALDALRAGELEVALVGGADSLCRLTFAGFNSLRAVDPTPAKPFDRRRKGLNLGEGAAVLVLESAERARARGARPYARVLGYGVTADAFHMTQPDASGAAWERTIRAALADAGVTPAEVDYINAHGTATEQNDPAEVAAYRRVFGEHLARIPVSSVKGALGHCLCGAGGIEAAITALAVARGIAPPTAGFAEADPACPLDPVPGVARAWPIRVAVSSSFAFGGNSAALALGTAT